MQNLKKKCSKILVWLEEEKYFESIAENTDILDDG